MDISVLIFLSSGLFLGWSLGANDAANVFGTAVGTRMVRFSTAALICSVFVILGAVFDGAGAAHTLGKLGAVNALGGAFVSALAAALTVYWMTRFGLPVSTSQAVVGAIVGWNMFSGFVTDMDTLSKIVGTWIACPILSGVIAVPLFKLTECVVMRSRIHLVWEDMLTRGALVLAGAFGAYALGANNIANVMGVFVPASPFTDFSLSGFTITGVQQLFFLGALAIGVGVFTYSRRVMMTVGSQIVPLSPVAAWVVVVAHSIVLFLFASAELEHFLASHDLPTFPLVPVSSSQAVVGAVIGIGLYKGGHNIRWRVLGSISAGWVITPLIAALGSFVALFVVQNVFNQKVYEPVPHVLSEDVMDKLKAEGTPMKALEKMSGRFYASGQNLKKALLEDARLGEKQIERVISRAAKNPIFLDPEKMKELDIEWIGQERVDAVKKLKGRRFDHVWQLADALARESERWQLLPKTKVNRLKNRAIKRRLGFLADAFGVKRAQTKGEPCVCPPATSAP